MLKGNMLIAHGGGPTPVINSSLLGAVREAKKHPEIETVYGARFGAEGILAGDLIDLGAVPDEQLDLLARTPASAIGSCRRKLTDADYPAVLECFKKFNIRYFFYNGGNDSMDTCNKVYQLAVKSGYELRVIGIPKTIDNDLAVTDHCPGFGSAAKYAAASALEIAQDAAALPIHVVVMEMMGRNAGWITAASALFTDLMPCEHLVYLPETDFDKDEFLAAVKEKWAKGRGLLVTVSEGIHYAGGAPVADSGIVDGFGHKVPGGAAQTLSDMIMNDERDGHQVPQREARPARPHQRGADERDRPRRGRARRSHRRQERRRGSDRLHGRLQDRARGRIQERDHPRAAGAGGQRREDLPARVDNTRRRDGRIPRLLPAADRRVRHALRVAAVSRNR